MARNQTQSMARSHQRRLDNLTIILGAVFLVVAIITAVVAYGVVNDLVRSWTMTPLDGVAIPTLCHLDGLSERYLRSTLPGVQ